MPETEPKISFYKLRNIYRYIGIFGILSPNI